MELQKIKKYKKRISRRFISASGITIDPKNSTDLDDALFYKLLVKRPGYIKEMVEVYVPNVSIDLYLGHPLLTRAEKLGGTDYHANDTHTPMTNHEFEEKFSLMPGESRDVMVLTIIFENGEITDSYLRTGKFINIAKLDYEEVDMIMKSNTAQAQVDSKVIDILKGLYSIKDRYLAKSKKKHTVDHESLYGQRTQGSARYTSSRELVSFYMKLANTLVKILCDIHGIPAPSRNHKGKLIEKKSDGAFTSKYLSKKSDLKDKKDKRVTYLRARFNLESKGHYALDEESYTQFTSPMRRYQDIIVHMNIWAYMNGQPFPFPAEVVQEKCNHLNRMREYADIRKLERIIQRYVDDELDFKALNKYAFSRLIIYCLSNMLKRHVEAEIKKHICDRIENDTLQAIDYLMILFRAPDKGWERIIKMIYHRLNINNKLYVQLFDAIPHIPGVESLSFEKIKAKKDGLYTYRIVIEIKLISKSEVIRFKAGTAQTAKGAKTICKNNLIMEMVDMKKFISEITKMASLN